MIEKKEKPKLTWQEVVSKGIPIIGLVVLAIVLCLLIHLGSEGGITVEQALLVCGGVAAIFGIKYRRNGNGTGTTAAGALLLCITALTGCAGYRPPDNACETENLVVASLAAGLDAAESVVGDRGGEEWETTFTAARGTLLLGTEAIRACELARDGAGWQQWVGLALEAALSVAAFINGAGPADVVGTVPPELERAIDLLELESRL